MRLLVLDDWGLEPFAPDHRRNLLEIVEERYGRGAILITSQIPVDQRTPSSASRPSPMPSSTESSNARNSTMNHSTIQP